MLVNTQQFSYILLHSPTFYLTFSYRRQHSFHSPTFALLSSKVSLNLFLDPSIPEHSTFPFHSILLNIPFHSALHSTVTFHSILCQYILFYILLFFSTFFLHSECILDTPDSFINLIQPVKIKVFFFSDFGVFIN